MGRSLADVQQRYPNLPYQFQASDNGLPLIVTAAGPVNPVGVSADILRALSAHAQAVLEGELDGVVINEKTKRDTFTFVYMKGDSLALSDREGRIQGFHRSLDAMKA
ncbi:Hsp70 family protein, partial [Escherichia coli]|uniref:Hsp70 family protein n=1 Tax=Escherichia coli TaxID=562 RepID=UPI0022823ECF